MKNRPFTRRELLSALRLFRACDDSITAVKQSRMSPERLLQAWTRSPGQRRRWVAWLLEEVDAGGVETCWCDWASGGPSRLRRPSYVVLVGLVRTAVIGRTN